MITLKEAGPEHKTLLWNLHQKYLYEMTRYYDNEMDAQGNYHYGYFDAYFTEAERRAILIYSGSALAGFAMINPYSYIGGSPDYVMAEFTVFPAFRGQGLGFCAAEMILKSCGGRWEIKYHEENTGAKRLWNRLCAPYHPEAHSFSRLETVLAFEVT